MPQPSPSRTHLNQGPGPTAVLLGLFCVHLAAHHHLQHLHPLHHLHWEGSQIARGLTTVLTQACQYYHSTALSVCGVFWLTQCQNVCMYSPTRLVNLWGTAHTQQPFTRRENCDGYKRGMVKKKKSWHDWNVSLAPSCGFWWTLQKPDWKGPLTFCNILLLDPCGFWSYFHFNLSTELYWKSVYLSDVGLCEDQLI